jgi:hypothetical protein
MIFLQETPFCLLRSENSKHSSKWNHPPGRILAFAGSVRRSSNGEYEIMRIQNVKYQERRRAT